MSLLKIIETPEEEYKLFKQDLYDENPKMVVLSQTDNSNDVFVEKKVYMPTVLKLFLGGISAVGLYMVYRMTLSKR